MVKAYAYLGADGDEGEASFLVLDTALEAVLDDQRGRGALVVDRHLKRKKKTLFQKMIIVCYTRHVNS